MIGNIIKGAIYPSVKKLYSSYVKSGLDKDPVTEEKKEVKFDQRVKVHVVERYEKCIHFPECICGAMAPNKRVLTEYERLQMKIKKKELKVIEGWEKVKKEKEQRRKECGRKERPMAPNPRAIEERKRQNDEANVKKWKEKLESEEQKIEGTKQYTQGLQRIHKTYAMALKKR